MTAPSVGPEALAFLHAVSVALDSIPDSKFAGGEFYIGEVSIRWGDGPAAQEQLGVFRPNDFGGYDYTPEYKDMSR